MHEKILRLLRENAKFSSGDIAERLAMDESEVCSVVTEMEKNGVIKGYQAVIDESLLPESKVKAIIAVNVRPNREGGFDGIAHRLAKFS